MNKTTVDNSVEKNSINRPVFDILRCLATAMVFLIHFLGYRNVGVPGFVFIFFKHLSLGVPIFFAMSGYLVMQSYAGSKSVKEYFIKRVSRIIPAYYAILIFGIIVWDIVLGKMPADTMLGLGWLRYFLFLNAIVPSNEYYFWNDLWGLWTMSCFMLFYLCVPLVQKFVKTYKASLVLMVLVVVGAYGYKAVIYYLLNLNGVPNAVELAGDSAVFNLISFSFGVIAWYAVKENKVRQYLSLIVVLLFAFLSIREDTYNRIIYALLAVAFMLSMKDFEYGKRTQWIGNILSVLSKYSFTVYLVHMPVLQLLEYYSENYHYLGVLPFTILTVALVAVVTILLNRFVERPFGRLIKKLL